jgi:hypothetical protein
VTEGLISRVATQFLARELAELIRAIKVVSAWNRRDATARRWPRV